MVHNHGDHKSPRPGVVGPLNHERRISPLNNQDSMESKAVFFSHMICDFMIQGFQMTEDP